MTAVVRALVLILFIALIVSAGCTGEDGSNITYVCPNGETVLDLGQCSKSSATPSSTIVIEKTLPPTQTPHPSTAPPLTSSTTLLSTTTTAPTTTTSSTSSSTSTTVTTTTSTSTSQRLTTTSSTTTTTFLEPKPLVEIVEETMVDEPNQKFWIGGKIKNKGGAPAYSVKVKLILYNKAGTKLYSMNTAPIDVVEPGETLDFNVFKTEILKVNVERYTLTVQYS